MKPTWLISAVFTGLFALAGFAMPAQDHGRDVSHRALHKFDRRDREAARKWYKEHRENLPEGFRDEHPLSSEDTSRFQAGVALDSDARKKVRPVPVDLLRWLPPPPRHYRYAVLNERILLVEDRTWSISDIIDLHGDEGRPGDQEIRKNSIIGFVMKAGKRDAMPEKTDVANELHIPVAIFEKELLSATSFRLQTFELCTVCGARFGIGYHGECAAGERFAEELEDLPKKLTAILAKDHRQERAHKHFIELDI